MPRASGNPRSALHADLKPGVLQPESRIRLQFQEICLSLTQMRRLAVIALRDTTSDSGRVATALNDGGVRFKPVLTSEIFQLTIFYCLYICGNVLTEAPHRSMWSSACKNRLWSHLPMLFVWTSGCRSVLMMLSESDSFFDRYQRLCASACIPSIGAISSELFGSIVLQPPAQALQSHLTTVPSWLSCAGAHIPKIMPSLLGYPSMLPYASQRSRHVRLLNGAPSDYVQPGE